MKDILDKIAERPVLVLSAIAMPLVAIMAMRMGFETVASACVGGWIAVLTKLAESEEVSKQ